MAGKPVGWTEIRKRAIAFSKEFEHAKSEASLKQTFWHEFFGMFGLKSHRIGSFEVRAKRHSTQGGGWIDYLWPGHVAIEHKSAGKSLDDAEEQNLDYLDSLGEADVPQLLVACDFKRFRVTDLVTRETIEFDLADLAQNIRRFGPIAGHRKVDLSKQEDASIKAAELLGKVYTALESQKYTGHDLAVFSVRLLFVLFADDTGVWQNGLLEQLIEERTSEDGSDLGAFLNGIFEVLNTPEDARQDNLDEDLKVLPYINGGLFSEHIATPIFDGAGRLQVLKAAGFNWAPVSPAIFGSIFQSVKDPEARRELGSHYTTEANIMRVIGPLFLDDLRAEFDAAYNSAQKLDALRKSLAKLTFLDPAMGCGNFLIVTYRELRRLELEILVRLRELANSGSLSPTMVGGTKARRGSGKASEGQLGFDATLESVVHVGQFFGIEIDEFPARIASTAMFLVDHLENMRLSDAFGDYYARFPIKDEAHIVVGNACRLDWNSVVPASDLNYILGNPPFIGRQYRTDEQVEDMRIAHGGAAGHGPLDYVTAWYVKAVEYMTGNTAIHAGFVSTNSITQGENVALLWPRLIAAGVSIRYAIRTFRWGNEARNKAAVHCVIIGFSLDTKPTTAPIYEEVRHAGGGTTLNRHDAKNINPYLVDGDNVIVVKRRKPLNALTPLARLGSMPNDGDGFLIPVAPLSPSQKDAYDKEAAAAVEKAKTDPKKSGKTPPPVFYPEDLATVQGDPIAAPYVRSVVGAEELINGLDRRGFWLAAATASDLRKSKILKGRLARVQAVRLFSNRATTNALAKTPQRWGEDRQPTTNYLAIAEVSSESREYVPIVELTPDVVATNKIITVSGGDLYLFGILQSAMHMAWLRAAGGRLKSDYQYSPGMVYNTFPHPDAPTAKARLRVEAAMTAVLAARGSQPTATLADLYDPAAMPPALRKAHNDLDAAVDALYTNKKLKGDIDRQALLLARYEAFTATLVTPVKRTRKRPRP